MRCCSSLHRKIVMDGSPEPVRSLRTAVETFLRDHALPEKEVRALVLAFSEALDNAVEHGTVGTNTIELRLRYSPRFLLLSLRDSGSDKAPVGTVVANHKGEGEPDHDSERGRGFTIMNKVMDNVRVRVYPTGGTRVSMLRRLSAS